MDAINPLDTLEEAYWWLNDPDAKLLKPPIYELIMQITAITQAETDKDQPAAIRICQEFLDTEKYMPSALNKLVTQLLDAVKSWEPLKGSKGIDEACDKLRDAGGSYLQNTYPYIIDLRKAVHQHPDEVWSAIERLCSISKQTSKDLEAGEVLVECGWAAYRLKNNYRAIQLLEEANRRYNTRLRQTAVVYWTIGCIHWVSYQPEKAHIAWRHSINRFEKLASQRMLPPGTDTKQYQDILDQMKGTLEYAVTNEHQKAAGTSKPPGSEPPKTPPPPDEPSTQKKENQSGKQERKAERAEPMFSDEEWFETYSGNLVEAFPIVEKVPAGRWRPTPDDPNIIGKVAIGPVWIEDKPYVTKYLRKGVKVKLGESLEKHVVIKITGDSMNRAKPFPIEDNDYVLLYLQDDAEDGDIVAAKYYDEADRKTKSTIKRLSKIGKKVTLKPESTFPKYPELEGNFEIVGLALAVFKPVQKDK